MDSNSFPHTFDMNALHRRNEDNYLILEYVDTSWSWNPFELRSIRYRYFLFVCLQSSINGYADTLLLSTYFSYIYFVGFLAVYKLNSVVLEIRKYATRNVKKICAIYKIRLMSILFCAANTKYVTLIVTKRMSFPFVVIFSDQFFFSSRYFYFWANGLCFNPQGDALQNINKSCVCKPQYSLRLLLIDAFLSLRNRIGGFVLIKM